MIQHMETNNLRPSEVTYSLLLNGLGKQGELFRAFEILDSMRSKGMRVNVVTRTALVDACGRNGQLDLAFKLYYEMAQSKVANERPNSITCSCLIDACLKAGYIDRAFDVIRDMRTWGVALTEVTYTSLISELTRLGELDRILEVVQGEAEEGIPPAVRLPNGNAFFPTSCKTIVLDGSDSSRSSLSWASSLPPISTDVSKELVRLLSRAERMDAALDILEGIASSSSLPPRETVELVVAAVTGAKELDRAASIVHKVMLMVSNHQLSPSAGHGLSADHYTQACEVLLRASQRADGLLKAYEIFSAAGTDSGSRENAYAALMDAFREGRNHSAVLQLFETMREDGVRNGPATLTSRSCLLGCRIPTPFCWDGR